MNEHPPPSIGYRFGPYFADTVGLELQKSGTRIRLQPKPFQVLTVLLGRAGQAVSREELKKLLWGPDIFVDFDHGLNTAVNKIREALGDSAEKPRYIETLPNGYKFIGEVSEQFGQSPVAPASNTPSLGTAHDDPERAISSRRRYLGASVGLACLIAVVFLAIRIPRKVFGISPAIQSVAVLPLKNLSGDPSQEYFSDSMTDELITQLAKISSLKVSSAASVVRYKNSSASAS